MKERDAPEVESYGVHSWEAGLRLSSSGRGGGVSQIKPKIKLSSKSVDRKPKHSLQSHPS